MPRLIGLAWLALTSGWATADGWAAEVRPPRSFTANQPSRWDRLLSRETRYLLREYGGRPLLNHEEHAIRPVTSAALAAAVCVRSGLCGPGETAVALELIGKVAAAHVTAGGTTQSGKPWGHQWQSALWAWLDASAAWLLWGDLPASDRSRVVAMLVDEADRFVDLPAPSAEFFDTKGEENSWNSLVLILAAVALPDHPHAPGWERRGREYMISAAATRDDARARESGIRGANVHSDFTLENHGFVHPDYMSAVPYLNLLNALVYRLAGRSVPEACVHNAVPIYSAIKRLTMPDGGVLYPSGTDWCLHRIDIWAVLHDMMARIAGDPQGDALSSLGLDTLEKMQSRSADGRTFVAGEFPSYPTHEGQAGWNYAMGKLADSLWQPAKSPQDLATVWKTLEGGTIFDDAKWLVLRTSTGVASFSWGLRVMGQTVPFSPDPILAPMLRSYVGTASPIPETGEGEPSRLGIVSKHLQAILDNDPIVARTVIPGEESGARYVTVAAGRGSGAQVFSFTALPSGKSVFLSRGEGDVGTLFLLQEPQWVYGEKLRAVRGDRKTWLNVDGRLGFAVAGGAGIQVRPEVKGQLVILSPATGSVRDTAIVTIPGADADAARRIASSGFVVETGHPDVLSVSIDGFLVVSCLTQSPVQVTVQGRRVAVYGYSTRVLRTGAAP